MLHDCFYKRQEHFSVATALSFENIQYVAVGFRVHVYGRIEN